MDGISSLDDIRRGRYQVVSYLGNEWIKSAVEAMGIHVQYANSVEGMYRMLASRRAELIIEEASLASPRIQQLNLAGKIIRTNGVGSESGFHLLIGKRSPFVQVMPHLEATLTAMEHDGTIATILEKYGVGKTGRHVGQAH